MFSTSRTCRVETRLRRANHTAVVRVALDSFAHSHRHRPLLGPLTSTQQLHHGVSWGAGWQVEVEQVFQSPPQGPDAQRRQLSVQGRTLAHAQHCWWGRRGDGAASVGLSMVAAPCRHERGSEVGWNCVEQRQRNPRPGGVEVILRWRDGG